ncbi:asparagine synthase C-terminal domain-containing protein [Luteimonas sp. BDR2-5]|uniref:asparagine synthase-related protein n=1 Tax=Proluteimonas luteida TaxID=2878685 RepID=UPI001E4DEFD5|nr:asparagine synthase-related protein [Luteimonas sp. BDR2-5]MCD9027839.1 asparagine synthase C-terminal domain-containing protein [Luteimonas sp. BDR2-5]
MAYRYIALIDAAYRAERPLTGDAEHGLRAMDMHQCMQTAAFTLYVSGDTPTIRLSGSGVIIGHLFSRSGAPITNEAEIPHHSDGARLRRLILENCWGAYLIIQPGPDNSHDLEITRDPEGGMPCFHHVDADAGFLASDLELPTRMGLYRKRIDWESILHRLIYPDIKTSRTGLDRFEELLPGIRLTLRGSSASTHTEWSPWDFVGRGRRHDNSDVAAAAVRSATDTVVGAWAMTDRSALLELSGGLDSSIVGASLKGSAAHVVCCTMVTPVPGADERQYACQIADLLGATLDVQTLRFEYGLHDFDQHPQPASPRVGMLQHATDTIMELARRRHGAASFFSGGGGDTVFCYLTTAAPAADAFRVLGFQQGFRAIRNLAELHQCTLWRAGRLTVSKLVRPPESPYRAIHELINPANIECAPEKHPWLDAPDAALPGDRERIFALATTQVYRDSAPRGLRRHLRLPLLSQPVMEASLRTPSWMWISDSHNRAVARKAFADVLPTDVITRRSKGSFAGYVGALYARNRERIRDYLLDGHLQAHGILDARALRQSTDRDLAPRDCSYERVLELCMVENWVRHQI